MDAYERSKENHEWNRTFLSAYEPLVDKVFKVFEWAIVVGLFKYLMDAHGGGVLSLVYTTLHALLAAYIIHLSWAYLPFNFFIKPDATGFAKFVRSSLYLVSALIVVGVLSYTMLAVTEAVKAAQGGTVQLSQ